MNKEQKITTELRRVLNITDDISDDEILRMTSRSLIRASVELNISINDMYHAVMNDNSAKILKKIINKICESSTKPGKSTKRLAKK